MSAPITTGNAAWWHTVLDRLSELILHSPGLADQRSRVPADAIERNTLLRPGASAEELAELETRIGRPYSASLRTLLQASNGFAIFGQHLGRLLTAAEIDWFPKRNPVAAQEIEDYLKQGNPKRPPYAKDPKWTVDIPLHAIEITESFNGATLLLHPRRGRGGGEWDIWLYKPGSATRIAMLTDFLEQELRALSKHAE